MANELEEQLESFLEQVERRIPTLEQKKRITKAGAKIYKKALKENTPNSGHKESKHVMDSLKQQTDSTTGNSSVFFSTQKGDKGYIARFLNDGYMSHGGKGKSTHNVKFIPGRHFVETTYVEERSKIVEAMEQAYDEEMRRE